MKIIAESKWQWVLYQDKDEYILSVVCGTVGIYCVNFLLSNIESEKYQTEGSSFIDDLAISVRGNSEPFLSRQIQDIENNEDTKLAVKECRAQV